MGTLVAPASRGMVAVESDVYVAEFVAYTIEDWTEKPDKFGESGHTTIIFKFDTFLDPEDGTQVEQMWIWVKLATGDKANLTKITRAFGLPDLRPGDPVDLDAWLGKRLRATVAQKDDGQGGTRPRLLPDGFMPLKKAKPIAGMAAPRPACSPRTWG